MFETSPHAIRIIGILGLASTGWFCSELAHAEPTVLYLAEQLSTNDDYRVRTQAALALGASNDPAAIKPLCAGLSDSNVSVRAASAAAIGKLGNAEGLACLQDADSRESTSSVKSQIQKSITSLRNGNGAQASTGAEKYYVVLEITNKTTRSFAEIDALIRTAMQQKMISKPGYLLATKNESVAQGVQIVKSKSLKAFVIQVAVEPPNYNNTGLSQSVRATIWSFPSRALKGEFSPKMTQPGTISADPQSETELLRMCAETVADSFQKLAGTM